MLHTERISKDKNLDFIIEIFKNLKSKYDFIKFFIVGDGVYLNEIKEKYSNLHDLIFTGSLENDKLVEYYNLADIMVFPSITDTFGMSVLEAQACGLPVLVSNIGGPKTIVKNGETGYVLKINKKIWEKKITELIEDKKNNGLILKRLSLNSRFYVEDKFDINNVIDSYFVKEDVKVKYNRQGKNINPEDSVLNLGTEKNLINENSLSNNLTNNIGINNKEKTYNNVIDKEYYDKDRIVII